MLPCCCLAAALQVLYSYIFGIFFFSEHLTLFGVLGSLLVALGELKGGAGHLRSLHKDNFACHSLCGLCMCCPAYSTTQHPSLPCMVHDL